MPKCRSILLLIISIVPSWNVQAQDWKTVFSCDYESVNPLELSKDPLTCLGRTHLDFDQSNLSRMRIDQEIFRNRNGELSGSSLRSELRSTDSMVYLGKRAESDTGLIDKAASYREGDIFRYKFSIYLPSTWQDDGANEDILFQWHRIKDAEDKIHPPNIMLQVKRDRWILRHNDEFQLVDQLDLGPIRPGRFQDFDIVIYWSSQCGKIEVNTGAVDQEVMWKANYTGPTMLKDQNPGYIQWGIYKPTWNACGPTSPCLATHTEMRAVWHDNIEIQKAAESFKCPVE